MWKQEKPLTFDEVYNQSSPTNCTVYFGGIVSGFSEELLQKAFAHFGSVREVRIFKDKGYAFIRFSTKVSAARAIVAVHNTEVNGHTVKCSWGKFNVIATDAISPTSTMSSAPVNKTSETAKAAASSPSSAKRFAQFQSSFYRKTSFAPKIKRKGGIAKKEKEAKKGSRHSARLASTKKMEETWKTPVASWAAASGGMRAKQGLNSIHLRILTKMLMKIFTYCT